MRGLVGRVATVLSTISTIAIVSVPAAGAAEQAGRGPLPMALPQLQRTGAELSVVRTLIAEVPVARAPSVWDAPRSAPRGFRPRRGQVAFRMSIPRLGLSQPVREGVSQAVLARGLGHYPSCRSGFAPPYCADFPAVWPGEKGRMLVGAHRTISPALFYDLDRVRPGDRIGIRAGWGRFLYRVHHTRVVDAADRTIVRPGVQRRELVLVTCHPRGSSRQRLLVFARLAQPRA